MKSLARSLVACGIFLLFILALLFTHIGNLLLWQQVQHWVPQLQGELVAGHIGKGLSIEKLVWKDPQVTFHADRLTADWQLSSLLKKQLWITRLEAVNPIIQLADTSGDQSASPDKSAAGTTSNPLSITIDKIIISGFNLHSSDVHVSFKHLDSSLVFYNNGLSISDSSVQLLAVAAKKQAENPHKQSVNSTEILPVALPPIELPFAISIKQIQLTDSLFETEKVPRNICCADRL